MKTKITLHSTEEFELSDEQIALIRRLSNRSEYLHNEESDLADKTPGIYDSGEGHYCVSQRGWRILFKLNENAAKVAKREPNTPKPE